MLFQLEAENTNGDILGLPFGGGAEPIYVRNIDGLGPVTANINTTPFGSFDGESYTGSSVGKRNIVLTVGLNPDWASQSMEDLRHFLYPYFMPKRSVKLRFSTDVIGTVEILGYVESFVPNIFSKDPEIQVSIICPKPDFVAITATVVTGGVGNPPENISYPGTVPTGFIVKLESSTARPSYSGAIRVVKQAPFAQLLWVDGAVDNLNYFEMSSIAGNKYVHNVATAGAITNLLRTLVLTAGWPRLEPGANQFSIGADAAGQAWTLTYFSRFGGL